ncbi:MAG: helix-turn-helix domain-containing protein, partial [Pseudomonas sp.]
PETGSSRRVARPPEHLVEQQRTLGRYLTALRDAAGLFQADIARAVPCHRTTVTHAEAGSQLPASDFWETADRLLGANGALIARYDELIHAKTAHLAQQQTKRRAQGHTTAQQLTAAADSTPGSPAVPGEGNGMQRRETLQLGLALTLTPELLHRVLSDAATEAMEFTRRTAVSAVGAGTLEHLESVVSDLNRAYLKDPPAEQFVVARAYRSRVDELIQERHTLRELQALYVYAAWLSELLAWLAYDLGNPRTAQAYALDCYTYANEAGHGELCGWAANTMASIAMDSQNPDGAIAAALQGAAKVSTNHPLAVQLRAHAARAYARSGQREPCATLFAEAQRLRERLPARVPRRFTMDTGIHASYAMTAFPASAYLWLGNLDTARTHGEAALTAIESAPPGSREQRQALAQLILATALVGLGAPDDAVSLGNQVLTSMRMNMPLVATRARDLNRALVSQYPKLACVREFHEQYRHIAQRSTTKKEL